MNFESFERSPFYVLGSMSPNGIQGSTCIHGITDLDNIVSILPKNNTTGNLVYHTSLFKFITFEMPEEFSNLIIDQYIEVYSKITRLPRLPSKSYLAIQRPGTLLPKHKHGDYEQILTYSYLIDDQIITDGNNSNITLGSGVNERVINYTNSKKFVMTILDDEIHSSYSNEWRFFWVFNFCKKIEINSDIVSGFDFLDVNKV